MFLDSTDIITAVIQARMGSIRLPGKVLEDIDGKPIIQHVIDRVYQASVADHVIVAVPGGNEDKPLIDYLKRNCITHSIYYGDKNNLIDRIYQAATAVSYPVPKYVIRITADCPLLDPHLIRKLVQYTMYTKLDYCSVDTTMNFPDGTDVEMFKYSLLVKATKDICSEYEKEHVGPYMKRVGKVGFLPSNTPVKLSVDTMEDLKRVRKIHHELGDRANYLDLVTYIESRRYRNGRICKGI